MRFSFYLSCSFCQIMRRGKHHHFEVRISSSLITLDLRVILMVSISGRQTSLMSSEPPRFQRLPLLPLQRGVQDSQDLHARDRDRLCLLHALLRCHRADRIPTSTRPVKFGQSHPNVIHSDRPGPVTSGYFLSALCFKSTGHFVCHHIPLCLCVQI